MLVLSQCHSWLNTAQAIIEQGGVVALPFERLFGLAAQALDEKAVKRVAAIKGRTGKAQPIAVIVPDLASVFRVVADFPQLAQELARKYWPGPLTLLLKARPDLPRDLVGPTGLIGVRVPGPSPAEEIARHMNCILTATSANLTGHEDALTHTEVASLDGLDAIVEGRIPGPPGTAIIDASTDRLIVVRPGCLEIKEVTT